MKSFLMFLIIATGSVLASNGSRIYFAGSNQTSKEKYFSAENDKKNPAPLGWGKAPGRMPRIN
jgi:hypothetical protein